MDRWCKRNVRNKAKKTFQWVEKHWWPSRYLWWCLYWKSSLLSVLPSGFHFLLDRNCHECPVLSRSALIPLDGGMGSSKWTQLLKRTQGHWGSACAEGWIIHTSPPQTERFSRNSYQGVGIIFGKKDSLLMLLESSPAVLALPHRFSSLLSSLLSLPLEFHSFSRALLSVPLL